MPPFPATVPNDHRANHGDLVEARVGVGGATMRMLLDRRVTVQRDIADALARGIGYEPETAQLFAGVLRPGDGFVDVGAHVGYFSLLAAAAVGPTGRVWSFEPDRDNYDGLLRQLEHGGLSHVRPLHMAVGDREGTVTFHANHDNDGGHALWDPRLHPANDATRASGGATRRVWMTTLDAQLRHLPPGAVRAMKVDVEGAELQVLRGARGMLERQRPFIVLLEINRFGLQAMGASEREVRDFMHALGYDLFAVLADRPEIQPLRPGDVVETNYIFNLLCRRREA